MSDPTLVTVRCAMLLYGATLGFALLGDRQSRWMIAARWLYTFGCACFLAHVAAAFHFRHHWSHAEAIENVRRQTFEMTGVRSGVGLWLNYLFAIVWVGDAAWWWSGRPRPKWAIWTVQAFMLFMAINATVVFPTGPTSIAGFAVIAALTILAGKRALKRRRIA